MYNFSIIFWLCNFNLIGHVNCCFIDFICVITIRLAIQLTFYVSKISTKATSFDFRQFLDYLLPQCNHAFGYWNFSYCYGSDITSVTWRFLFQSDSIYGYNNRLFRKTDRLENVSTYFYLILLIGSIWALKNVNSVYAYFLLCLCLRVLKFNCLFGVISLKNESKYQKTDYLKV